MDVESGLQAWQEKSQEEMAWSDPIRSEESDSFVESTKTICTQAVLNDVQLSIHQEWQEDDLQQKSVSRKKLKPFGSGLGLTKEKAEQTIAAKEQREKRTEEKSQHNHFMKLWRIERDTKYNEGVTARKEERARVREVKRFKHNRFLIPLSLVLLFLIPI